MIKEIVLDVMNFCFFKFLIFYILVEIKNVLFLSDDSFFLLKKKINYVIFFFCLGVCEEGVLGSG